MTKAPFIIIKKNLETVASEVIIIESKLFDVFNFFTTESLLYVIMSISDSFQNIHSFDDSSFGLAFFSEIEIGATKLIRFFLE